ncbi:MAG: hypothetical protein ACO1RX_11110 [Candidatus Sericytochromatia bacterium]
MLTMPFWPTPTTPVFRGLLLLLLCGCPAPPAAPEAPQPSASPLAPRFLLRVLTPSGEAVTRAELHLSHPLQAPRTLGVNSLGEADLSSLSQGETYLLEIHAETYLPLQRWLLIPREAQQRQTLILEPAQPALEGQVLTDQGLPLDQAVVQRGDLRVLTNAEGRFSLPQSPESSGPLEIAKQGYQPWSGPPGGARYSLNPTPGPRRLRLHTLPWPATQLQAASQSAGYLLLPWQEAPLDPSRDLLWLACPQAIQETQRQEISAFVRAGGKLVINSEWAGLSAYDLETVRALLSPWGMEPGGDSLQGPDGATLGISRFSPHALTQGLQRLELYRSASVRSLRADQGQLLAHSDSGVLRIQRDGGDSVLAAALGGLGKVVTLGDTSLWLDSDSNADGISNFATADHARLWQQILNW